MPSVTELAVDPSGVRAGVINVRDHGATGDGRTKDTTTLQAAIDACGAAGGGRVVVPPGVYVSGTLFLRSNVDLHLMAGARLVASADRADFNADDVFAENAVFGQENVSGAHLIIAYRVQNVSITGHGVIDGNSPAFLDMRPDEHDTPYRLRPRVFTRREWRPGQLVFFCRAARVRMRDVDVIDSPYWGVFLLGCDDVSITGLRIVNPAGTPNGDGIDVDCCRNVTISDCLIRSGDDSITIRGNGRPLGEDAQPCENVTVTNCVLTSSCCAIRVGVGNSEIRNVTFSNLVITDTRSAINVVCRYNKLGGHQPHIAPGCDIHHIVFTDLLIDCVVPITLTAGEGSRAPAGLHDISFSRLRIRASAGSHVAGSADVIARRVEFADIDLELTAGTTDTSLIGNLPEYPSVNGLVGRFAFGEANRPALPAALYAIRTEELRVDNMRIRWVEPGPVWRHAFAFTRCATPAIHNTELTTPAPGEGSAILIDTVDRITLRHCTTPDTASTPISYTTDPTATQLQLVNNTFDGQLSAGRE